MFGPSNVPNGENASKNNYFFTPGPFGIYSGRTQQRHARMMKYTRIPIVVCFQLRRTHYTSNGFVKCSWYKKNRRLANERLMVMIEISAEKYKNAYRNNEVDRVENYTVQTVFAGKTKRYKRGYYRSDACACPRFLWTSRSPPAFRLVVKRLYILYTTTTRSVRATPPSHTIALTSRRRPF